MEQFFKDEESPCGAVKTGFSIQIEGIVIQTWECGCRKKHYPNGNKIDWCGWLSGKAFRMLPGIFEPFVSQDDTRIVGNRNGMKLYQK